MNWIGAITNLAYFPLKVIGSFLYIGEKSLFFDKVDDSPATVFVRMKGALIPSGMPRYNTIDLRNLKCFFETYSFYMGTYSLLLKMGSDSYRLFQRSRRIKTMEKKNTRNFSRYFRDMSHKKVSLKFISDKLVILFRSRRDFSKKSIKLCIFLPKRKKCGDFWYVIIFKLRDTKS